jgi:uncharacterized protein (TIGR00251 family)
MALIIEVKVVPSAGKNGWILDKVGKLKGYLKSPPERGIANQELIDLLAKALKIPKQKVILVSGATSRIKRIKIEHELTIEQLYDALGIERQITIV